MSRETKPKDKRRAADAKTLEALVEILMLEVSQSHPGAQNAPDEAVKTWAHSTAIYISEILKRRAAPISTIIQNARRATKRRLERELADLYLSGPSPSPPPPAQTLQTPERKVLERPLDNLERNRIPKDVGGG